LNQYVALSDGLLWRGWLQAAAQAADALVQLRIVRRNSTPPPSQSPTVLSASTPTLNDADGGGRDPSGRVPLLPLLPSCPELSWAATALMFWNVFFCSGGLVCFVAWLALQLTLAVRHVAS
jgi:hypothetical protein